MRTAARAHAEGGHGRDSRRGPDGTESGNAPGRIRTCDFCLRRAALYPLSYGRLGLRELSGGDHADRGHLRHPHAARQRARCRPPASSELRERRRDPARRRLHARRGAASCCSGIGPPVHGVHGNVDDEALRRVLPATRVVELRRRADRDDPRRRAARRPARAHAPPLPGRRRRRLRPLATSRCTRRTRTASRSSTPAAPPSAARAPAHTMGIATRRGRARALRAGRRSLALGRGTWTSRSSSPAPPARCPTARRGLPALLLRARRRPDPVRLRRGHPAAAAALGRAARARRDLHHPLPPRPLARAARDAQDVRPARARAAADGLRPAGPAGAARRACARRAGRVTYPLVARGARPAREVAFDGYAIAPFPVEHRVRALRLRVRRGRPARALRRRDRRAPRRHARPRLRPPAARARPSTA